METLEEKEFRKNAPESPIPWKRYDNAWRAEIELRKAIGEAKKLLSGKSNGLRIVVNDYELWAVTRQDIETVFRISADCALRRLKYCESRAAVYIEIPKETKREIESIRLQIDEYFNA